MIFDIFDMDNAFQMRCGKSVIGGDRRRGRCFVARRSQDHLMYQFFLFFAWLLGSLVCAIDLWMLWKHITRRTWIGGLYSAEMHVFNEKTNVHVFVRVRVLLMLEGSYKPFWTTLVFHNTCLYISYHSVFTPSRKIPNFASYYRWAISRLIILVKNFTEGRVWRLPAGGRWVWETGWRGREESLRMSTCNRSVLSIIKTLEADRW